MIKLTLNFFTNIISTTFSSEIDNDKEIIECSEFVLNTFGYKTKNKTKEQLVLVPYWLSFFMPHPNAFIIRSKFSFDNNKKTIKLKVWHPLHLIISLICLFFIWNKINSIVVLVIPIFQCYFLVYSIINQKAIFKKILLEIEKEEIK